MRLLIGVVCVAASVLAGWLGRGLEPHAWAMWLAPAPVLLYARHAGARASAAAAFTAWLVAGLSWWSYLQGTLKLPLSVIVLALGLPAVAFAGGVLLWRWFRDWRAALALPCYWVAYEYLNMLTSPHGTFGNLAYTQMDYLPLVQTASVTGVWGVSFLLMLAPASIISRRALGAAVAAVVVVAAAGWIRLRQAPSGEPVPVTVLAERIEGEPAHFRQMAARTATDVVAGLITREGQREYNSAVLFPADGSPELRYHKHHLIPGFEDRFMPGTSLVTVERPSGRWGLLVCKDMDFPALSRAYGQQGIVLALVPAWDFVLDGWLHSRMAMMRGIENGFAVARNAREGLATQSDAYGRLGELRVRRVRTLYTRWGDWFAWLCLAGLAALVISRARTRRG